MSKKVKVQITCSNCGHKQVEVIYRTIWVEYPENMEIVLSDRINTFHCEKCNYAERLEFPFLCSNVKRGVAIWYEPYHDPQIDADVEGYRKHMGANSFYAKAPRIADWRVFKATLREMNAAGPQPGQEVKHSVESQKLFHGFADSLKDNHAPREAKWKGIIKELYVSLIGWVWGISSIYAIYLLVMAALYDGSWVDFIIAAGAAWALYRVALYYQLTGERSRGATEKEP
jgi:hypothetical protein